MAQDRFGNQVNLPRFETPQIPSGAFKWALWVILALLVVSTAYYTVEPDEVGVLLRFGVHKYNAPPGLHFKLPFGIDRVYPIPVQRQLTEEFGFRTQKAEVRSQFTSRGFADESNMLTGDLNAVVVEWVVQYRIVDPVAYLFKVRNARDTFRDMSEAVVREVVGDRTVNEVITFGRQEVASVVLNQLQVLAELYQTGIEVDQVVLQDVTPPDPVKPAFNEVNQAEQEKSQLISEAQSEYNKVIPRARGEAQQTILAAEGYALDRVNRAEGEASRFTALYNEYRKAPEVTRQRIYLETMRQILPKVGRKVVIDEDVRGVLPLLNLETAPAGRATAGRPAQGGGGS
jgi:membrane protease subunit HflK